MRSRCIIKEEVFFFFSTKAQDLEGNTDESGSVHFESPYAAVINASMGNGESQRYTVGREAIKGDILEKSQNSGVE